MGLASQAANDAVTATENQPSDSVETSQNLTSTETASESESQPTPVDSTPAVDTSTTASTEAAAATPSTTTPSAEQSEAKKTAQLEVLGRISLTKKFNDAVKDVFANRAFVKLPLPRQSYLAMASTIDFLAVQLAVMKKYKPEGFEKSGGFEAVFKRLIAQTEDYGVKLDLEEKKNADRIAAKQAYAKGPEAARAEV